MGVEQTRDRKPIRLAQAGGPGKGRGIIPASDIPEGIGVELTGLTVTVQDDAIPRWVFGGDSGKGRRSIPKPLEHLELSRCVGTRGSRPLSETQNAISSECTFKGGGARAEGRGKEKQLVRGKTGRPEFIDGVRPQAPTQGQVIGETTGARPAQHLPSG